jgi:hypothetical protein
MITACAISAIAGFVFSTIIYRYWLRNIDPRCRDCLRRRSEWVRAKRNALKAFKALEH